MNKKVIYIICLIAFIALLIVSTIFLNNNMNKTSTFNNTTNNINNLESKNTANTNKTSSVLEVTSSSSFKKEVLESDLPVLIDFYASWCNPCKILSPIVEKVASENNKIKVVKINVDKVTDITDQYKIYSLPTLVLIKNGVESDRLIGLSKKEVIESFLTKNNI